MKHLIYYGKSLIDHDFKLIEVGSLEYLGKRLQVWKWYKHRTMGRPILMLWKPQEGIGKKQ